MYYVYIVECSDHTLYTGWTVDLAKRIARHNSGQGAKYTRARRPVVLKYCEEYTTKKEAQEREYLIKKLPREQKLQLVKEGLSPSPEQNARGGAPWVCLT